MIQEKIVDLHLPYPNEKDRLVRVYIPEHDENQTLPVIYMTDGQNLFEEENCKYGCWHIREAVREEFKNTGKSAVIVGIYNVRIFFCGTVGEYDFIITLIAAGRRLFNRVGIIGFSGHFFKLLGIIVVIRKLFNDLDLIGSIVI